MAFELSGVGSVLHVDESAVYTTVGRDYGLVLRALEPDGNEKWRGREERTAFSQSLTGTRDGGVVWGVTAQGHNWGDTTLPVYAEDGTLHRPDADPVADRLAGPIAMVTGHAENDRVGVVALGGIRVVDVEMRAMIWSDPPFGVVDRASVYGLDLTRSGAAYAVRKHVGGGGFSLVHYDPQGHRRWVVDYPRDSVNVREPFLTDVVAVDGGCVVAESVRIPRHGDLDNGESTIRGAWLERYDEMGASLWRTEIVGDEPIRNLYVERDGDDLIAIAGPCRECEGPSDHRPVGLRIAKVSGDGVLEWTMEYPSSGVLHGAFAVASHGIYFVANGEDGARLVVLR